MHKTKTFFNTTTKYTFNIMGVSVFTSAQKIPEGKDTYCGFFTSVDISK